MYILFDHQDAGVLSKAKLEARGNRLITLPAWSPWSTLSLPCGVFFQAAVKPYLAVPDLTSGRASHSITFKEPRVKFQDGGYTTLGRVASSGEQQKKAVALAWKMIRTRG